MSVKRMLSEMDSVEITTWMARETIDPFLGEQRNELRNGLLVATLANIHRDRDLKPEPFIPKDFMFDFLPKVITEIDDEAQRAKDAELLNKYFLGLIALNKNQVGN